MRIFTLQATPAMFLAAALAGSSCIYFSPATGAAEPRLFSNPGTQSANRDGGVVVTDTPQELTIILQLKPVNPPAPAVRAKPENQSRPPAVAKPAPQQPKKIATTAPQLSRNPQALQVPIRLKPQAAPKARIQPRSTSDSSEEGIFIPVYPRYAAATSLNSQRAVPVAKPGTTTGLARAEKSAPASSATPAVAFLGAPQATPNIQVVQKISGPILPEPEGQLPQSPKSQAVEAPTPRPVTHDALNDSLRSDGLLIGLGGYSPVAFRKQWTLAAGLKQFSVSHRGVVYYLQSNAEKSLFRKKPESYAPALLGYDPIRLREEGRRVSGKIEFSTEYRGRLYLFETTQNRDRFLRSADKFSRTPEITLSGTR